MTPERWREIKRLLDACDDLAPEDRTAWLARECDTDPDLRRKVKAFLAHDDALTAFGATSAGKPALLEALDEMAEVERIIGAYRTERLLGQGGMGAVYLAHRVSDFEQRVALKLMRTGLEGAVALARFHTERQILARLEHPNIGRLLDGGTTDDGQPYFVMELIDGVPIDHYCDAHRLSVRERIELLLHLCDALRFAHRNLALHLDLKPGNILVTPVGVPKLLDFGVGQLLGQDREAQEVRGPRPMTLGYASPEQLIDEPLTTASDLYSLGVVLYELLTGRPPCGSQEESEAKRIWAICREPPSEPSVAVSSALVRSTDGEQASPEAVAASRCVSPRSLRRQLRGDLDAILMRVLHKDPKQRYPSVDQLESDLRRHLDGMPIEIRSHDPFYRMGTYAWRYRWSLAAATAVLALILSFTVALSNQLHITEREKTRSDRLSGFLVDLFRAAEPDRAGKEPSVRGLVDLGRQRLESELAEEPEARAQLLGTLGQVYYRLGHFTEADETLNASIAAVRQRTHEDHPQVAEALNDLAAVAYDRGDLKLAAEHFRTSIAIRERLGREEDLTKPRNNLAAILMQRGKLEEAEAIYRQSLDHRRTSLGARHPNVGLSLRNLATVLYLGGELDAAEALLREALDIRLEAFGRESAAVATTLAGLGRLAHARGELEHADTLYQEALSIRRRLLGPRHLKVAILQADWAKLLIDLDELETAEVLIRHASGPIVRHKPEGDAARANLEIVYGVYLAARGRQAAARICLTAGHRTLEQSRGPDVLPVRDARRRLESLPDGPDTVDSDSTGSDSTGWLGQRPGQLANDLARAPRKR